LSNAKCGETAKYAAILARFSQVKWGFADHGSKRGEPYSLDFAGASQHVGNGVARPQKQAPELFTCLDAGGWREGQDDSIGLPLSGFQSTLANWQVRSTLRVFELNP
jgi:hypothetical protein